MARLGPDHRYTMIAQQNLSEAYWAGQRWPRR